MFSNLMKVEIYRRKTRKFTNNGNSAHTEEIRKEIRKYLEGNENENTAYQN